MNKIKSFIDKHVDKHLPLKSSPVAHQTPPPPAPPHFIQNFPNEHDLYLYRRQHGVNLGSWFVLERWIADSPYRSAAQPGQSDLDVAKGSNAREILEHHWDHWIVEDDWSWMSQRGLNAVRIPIGFYHLCGADPSVLNGTEFADKGEVFAGAWSRIMNAIATAHRHGLGVLIDLHAAPGKQNADAHSGTSSSSISFFQSSNFQRTTHILTSLLTHLTTFTRTHNLPLPNLIGIELVNEPNPPGNNDHNALKKWYATTIEAMRTIDPNIPLYIGDSWRTGEYAGFVKSLGAGSSSSTSSFVALDHHLYRCFTQSDGATPASQHAHALRESKQFSNDVNTLSEAGAGLVVGEWSGALNPGSLHGVGDQEGAKREFVDAQLALFERDCAGWFWWTYKKEHRGDSGWSMRDAVEKGVFPSWIGMKISRAPENDGARREDAKNQAWGLPFLLACRRGADVLTDFFSFRVSAGAHCAWWDTQYPGDYEHWRFADGFIQGWDDAYMFFSLSRGQGASVSEIGFKGAWAKRRAAEHARQKGDKGLWEYEHGLAQGITAATADVNQYFS